MVHYSQMKTEHADQAHQVNQAQLHREAVQASQPYVKPLEKASHDETVANTALHQNNPKFWDRDGHVIEHPSNVSEKERQQFERDLKDRNEKLNAVYVVRNDMAIHVRDELVTKHGLGKEPDQGGDAAFGPYNRKMEIEGRGYAQTVGAVVKEQQETASNNVGHHAHDAPAASPGHNVTHGAETAEKPKVRVASPKM
jgi:hypothetical protein